MLEAFYDTIVDIVIEIFDMGKKNIFVLLPTERDLREFEIIRHNSKYDLFFYGKNPREDLNDFDISHFIKETLNFLKGRKVDAVIGTHDYPAALIASVVCRDLGLPSPSIESILVCQHKYYCRQLQKRIVPEAYVESKIVSAADDSKNPFPFPFFIKPVRSFFSILAAKIEDYGQYRAYLQKAREHFSYFNKPFNQLLKKYSQYEYDADHLLAERLIEGRQVTLEAYSFQGAIRVIGITDSKMYPNKISFKRFDYPADLNRAIKKKLYEVSEKIIKAAAFDNGILNIEFFIGQNGKEIKIIEINPRMCSQFADLVEKVNGINTYEVQTALATGTDPEIIHKNKRFTYASSFVLREFREKKILCAPDKKKIQGILQRHPDARIEIFAKEGDMLCPKLQDMSSIRYGLVNIGAESKKDLYQKYQEIVKDLGFQFQD